MTFDDYYKNRRFEKAFSQLTRYQQHASYYEAIKRGCLKCGYDDVVKLNVTNGKIYCTSCLEQGAVVNKALVVEKKADANAKSEKKKASIVSKPKIKPVEPTKLKPKKTSIKPKLNLLETAQVAKKAISKFPFDDFSDVADFLEGNNEIEETIKLLNKNISDEYKKNILLLYAKKNLKEDPKLINKDLKASMELGLRALFKNEAIVKYLDKGAVKSRIISKTHTWKDLKDEF
jgi:hypothetical protein